MLNKGAADGIDKDMAVISPRGVVGIVRDVSKNFSSVISVLHKDSIDPVYSGKALAGMIDYVRQGRFTKGQKIVFLHTGGSAGLFAYADTLKL